MKRIMMLVIVSGLVLVGCNNQNAAENNLIDQAENNDSTKTRVYSKPWDGKAIIVKQKYDQDDYQAVNEITDPAQVEKLIEILRNADWKEGVDVDIEPADYRFVWNSFEHGVWINDEYKRIEVIVAGQSNYGVLSKEASKVVFEILTNEGYTVD